MYLQGERPSVHWDKQMAHVILLKDKLFHVLCSDVWLAILISDSCQSWASFVMRCRISCSLSFVYFWADNLFLPYSGFRSVHLTSRFTQAISTQGNIFAHIFRNLSDTPSSTPLIWRWIPFRMSVSLVGSAVAWKGRLFLLQVLCCFFLIFCTGHEAIFFLLQIPQVFLQVPTLIIFSEGSASLPLTWCRSLHSKMCTKSPFTQLCRYWCWWYTSHLMGRYTCTWCI